jgi:UDP-glucose 4-epimerase
MVMLAENLNHKTYNVATGRASTPGELVSAIQSVYPDYDGSFLKEGATPGSPGPTYSDISRIKADTGYEPSFPVEKSVPDYIAWLRAGNAE